MQNPNVSNLLIKVAVHKDHDYTVVTFDGDLDKLGLESVRQQIDELVEKLETKYLVYDFTDLNFINSESIGYVITVYYRLIKKEKILAVVSASEHVKDVLQVIGINEMVGVYGDTKAFLDAIK
jgi:stage II sporulation protein AA (anti-sigma F factor antagonist)